MSDKNVIKSLTMQGLAVVTAGSTGTLGAPIAGMLSIAGVNVAPQEVDAVIVAVGVLAAAIGRWRAKGALKVKS